MQFLSDQSEESRALCRYGADAMQMSLVRAVASACILDLILRFTFPEWGIPRLLFISSVLIASSALLAETAHFLRLAVDAMRSMLESVGDLTCEFFALLTLVSWQFADFKQTVRLTRNPRRCKCCCGSGKSFKKCHGRKRQSRSNGD